MDPAVAEGESGATLRDRIRAFTLQRPLGRLLLLPVRVAGALRYYAPTLGGIVPWAVGSREYSNFTYEYTDRNRVFLEHLLARVTGLEPVAVRGYLDEPAADRTLRESLATCREQSPFRAVIDADLRLGRQLIWYALTRALQPGRVVEAGVGSGLSAALIGQALLRNGRDGNPGVYIGVDRNRDAGFLVGSEQRQVVTILHGDSVATLGGLDGPIDLFISDSHVSADVEYAECRAIDSRLSPGAVVATTVSSTLPGFAEETGREFLVFKEEPRAHWYPGAWIGFAFRASAPR